LEKVAIILRVMAALTILLIIAAKFGDLEATVLLFLY